VPAARLREVVVRVAAPATVSELFPGRPAAARGLRFCPPGGISPHYRKGERRSTMLVTRPSAGCGRKSRAPEGWLGRHAEAPRGHTRVVGVPDTTLPDTTPEEPVPGSVLGGKYQLRRLLGRGGMGVVYQAWDRLLQRQVAVKLLPADRWHDP